MQDVVFFLDSAGDQSDDELYENILFQKRREPTGSSDPVHQQQLDMPTWKRAEPDEEWRETYLGGGTIHEDLPTLDRPGHTVQSRYSVHYISTHID